MDERTPLLFGARDEARDEEERGADNDIHTQFCLLVGMKPSDSKKDAKQPTPGKSTLYGRVLRKRRHQNLVYLFTSSLSNSLLLTQVVLGAALTALGASQSSHILITIFGAMNTVIAGLVAYLKSRGQPMRARMFRDDLDRVVDEIENSEIMWLGIARDVHGYDEIAIDDSVSVRSEVARLTRLYDKAVRGNTANDPDMYQGSTFESVNAALRGRPGQQALPAPPASAPPAAAPASEPTPAALPSAVDPDEGGPATAPAKPKDDAAPEDGSTPNSASDAKDDSKVPSDGKDSSTEATPADRTPADQGTLAPSEDAKNDGTNGPEEPPNGPSHDNPVVDGETSTEHTDTTAGAAAPVSKQNAHDPDDSPATRR